MKEGTRIYYHGDIANDDGFGTITEIKIDKWGTQIIISMDDGRSINVSPNSFSKEYKGHGGTRFVTEEAYRVWKEKKVEITTITFEQYKKDFKEGNINYVSYLGGKEITGIRTFSDGDWVVCGKENAGYGMSYMVHAGTVIEIKQKEMRYVFGTKTNKWHLVDKSDRDFHAGYTEEEFKFLGGGEVATS